jgi:hypothetical protein
MLPKTSAANSRGCGESRRSGKTAAGWESVQGTAKREASCHHQPTPPPGRKNPAIVLYQADDCIESLLRHRLSFLAALDAGKQVQIELRLFTQNVEMMTLLAGPGLQGNCETNGELVANSLSRYPIGGWKFTCLLTA